MRTLALLAGLSFLPYTSACADPTAPDLVAKSIANYLDDWKAELNYSYTERDDSTDSTDKTELYQVNVVDGTPYNRLIARDGHPLNADEARKQAEKYQKMLDLRDKETPEQRQRRLRKYEDEFAFLKDIPKAFNMKMFGTETVNGRPNYVIELTPKPDFVPTTKYERIFPGIEGKLWIDEHDVRWTKAVAHVVDTISFGWIMARISPGAHITMLQEKVGEHWFPRKIEVQGEARIMLVKNRTIDNTITYDNYKPLNPAPAVTDAQR